MGMTFIDHLNHWSKRPESEAKARRFQLISAGQLQSDECQAIEMVLDEWREGDE